MPATDPAAEAPTAPEVPRRAPSVLQVPSIDDASAAASASLDQVASYAGMLQAAAGDDPEFYERLVNRGFLDSAIEYTRYSLELIDEDRHLDNDGFDPMIAGAVLEALLSARNMGTPVGTEPNLVDELRMAQAAATNAAKGLLALATRPTRTPG